MNTLLSSFFCLNKTQLHTHKFRGLITGVGVVSYYLAVYFLLPQNFPSRDSIVLENLLNPDNIYSTALSLGPILAGSLAFSLPALVDKLRKGKNSAKPSATSSAVSPAPIEPASIGSGTPSVSSVPPMTEQKSASGEPDQSAEKIAAMVEEIVSGKVTEMTNEVTIFKKDAASMKEDVENVKKSIETLTTSLESSLTDMKAFQAEMVNPLNFMRKYFETMDIKNLSDPTLGLPPLTPSLLADKGPAVPTAIEEKISEPKLEANAVDSALAHDCDPADNKEPADIAHATSIRTMTPSNQLHVGVEKQQPQTEESGGTPEDIGELLDGKLTLGKMMAMAPVLEKILRDIGSEGVDAMVDQYRLLGLKPDEERAMYNLVFMLKNFNMSSDDVVSKLYRLGQVVGIQDPQADLEYSKMQARKKTLTQKVNAGKPATSPAPKAAAESAGSATSVKSTPVTIRRGA